MPIPTTVVFVHGWSVTSTETYGQLPERLVREAAARGVALDARNVWLGRYISFRDEVRMSDLSRAFQAAVERDLADVLARGDRFACITHSTGGPVIRDWWQRYHLGPRQAPPCPMSHLVMLAPANFGSALAQLGASRLGRIKAWAKSIEPGTGVLDWLELGSPEAWELNRSWITGPKSVVADSGVFPFVLMGQTVDRKLYDHVNAYTGETGSDGVVRLAAANLNASFVRLEQEGVTMAGNRPKADALEVKFTRHAPDTVLKIIPGRAHSGEKIGILRSVRDDGAQHPTVDAVLACLEVGSVAQYDALRDRFDQENETTQEAERPDVHDRILIKDSVTFIDRFSMVIFRLVDEEGNTLDDFDLKLTASATPQGRPSPDLLPQGFLEDRQRNKRHAGTLTFFLNADVMNGLPAVPHPNHATKILRPALAGVPTLGIEVDPHVTSGFVHFLPAELAAERSMLERVVKPNQTTMVDVVMRRVVRAGAFRLGPLSARDDKRFSKTSQGDPIPS